MKSIGLLGCGRIGQVHALSLSKMTNARLVAVADAVPSAAEAIAGTYGASIRTADEIIASSKIDAVIIATPTPMHYEQIQALCKAGKAVFCEKPIDLSSERAEECRQMVAASGIPFMTAFNRRFDPGFARMKEEIEAGSIGAPELVVITSRDPAPPPISYIKSSGGLFRDMMIHDFDLARFLLCEEIVEVFATGSSLVDPAIGAEGDIDTAAVTLRTSTGKLCQINNSRRAVYGYDQRAEVHGATGLLQAANQPENFVTRGGETGFTSAPNKHFFLERYEVAYFAEMRAFVQALESGEPMSPSIEDGVSAQRLADAAALSCETGKPVRL